MYTTLGMDYALGLRLPSVLQRRGLQHLTVEHEAPLSVGGPGIATIMKLSAEQLREKYLSTGVVTEDDLDTYGRFAEDPHTLGHLLCDGRGQRAEDGVRALFCA
jgi:hypothetical protein